MIQNKFIQSRPKIKSIRKIDKKHKALYVQKKFNPIQTSHSSIYQNLKSYKGNRTDTNLLNINFKTIICNIIQPLCTMKQIPYEEIKSFFIYKASSPNFENLIHMIYYDNQNNDQKSTSTILSQQKQNQVVQNQVKRQINSCNYPKQAIDQQCIKVKSPKILQRLRKLFQSKQIIKKIFQNNCNYLNRMLMIKYIQAIRYTIIGDGSLVRWKDLKKITVLA